MATEAPEAPAAPTEGMTSIRDVFDKAFAEAPETRDTFSKVFPSEPKPEKAAPQAKAIVEPPKAEPPKEEPKAEEPPKEDPKVEEEPPKEEAAEVAPKGMDAKAAARWGELKKENKEYKQKFAALENQLKELQSTAQKAKELEEKLTLAQKEAEEMNGELYHTRVEKTREYKKTVLEPLDDTLDQAESLAKVHNLDAKALAEALYKDSKGESGPLDELIGSLPERHRNKIYSLSDNIMQIDKRAQELKADAKRAYETSLEREQREAEELSTRSAEIRDKAAANIRDKFENKISPFLPDDVAVDFSRVSSDAKEFDSWKDDEKVFAGFTASVFPEVIQSLQAYKEQVETLESELAKYRNGGPKATAGTAPASPAAAAKPQDASALARMSWDEMAAQSAARLTGRAA